MSKVVRRNLLISTCFAGTLFSTVSVAQVNAKLQTGIDTDALRIESKMIEWRRHIHQFPELSNRETKTAAYVARHLLSLGLEVHTNVAHTGVVALLKTGKPGPVIALRADMDALPVTERSSLSFASKEKTTYGGQETGIMHACGHDSHVAILMATAEVLSKHKSELKGTIKFIFQPAEEGAPTGEEGGAKMMVKEGVLENPKVEAIFGLHISSMTPVGTILYKPGGVSAANDNYEIKIKGKQSHGSAPWMGVDPIVISSQIILGIQTIISRQTELTKEAAVITVGKWHSGIRENIIPEEATLAGTIRTLDTAMQNKIHKKLKSTAEHIAESAGAKAEVIIYREEPVTFNNPALTQKMLPSLQKAAGKENVKLTIAGTGAEDFAYYAEKIPALFFSVGAYDAKANETKTASHHTPDFHINEDGFITGLKAMLDLTVDYMFMKK
jgi:amidohydrolase